MIYYILFGIFAFEAIVEILGFRKRKGFYKFLFVISGIFLVVMCALRDKVGYDYYNYLYLYKEIGRIHKTVLELSTILNLEPLYIVLNKISTNYQQVLIYTALISIIPCLVIIYKYSKMPFVTLFMYYCGIYICYNMGIIRQGVAITFVFIALISLINNNKKGFWIAVVIATLFHTSSITAIPVYFLRDREFSRKTYYTGIVISIALAIISSSETILKIVDRVPWELIQTKTEYYVDYSEESLTTSIIKRIIVFVVFLECYKRNGKFERSSYIYLNSYFASIILTSMLASIPLIGGRGTAAIYMTQIFVYPVILKDFNKVQDKLIVFVLMLYMFYITMIGPISDAAGNYIPYNWCINI